MTTIKIQKHLQGDYSWNCFGSLKLGHEKQYFETERQLIEGLQTMGVPNNEIQMKVIELKMTGVEEVTIEFEAGDLVSPMRIG